MPSITIQVTRSYAVELYNAINAMPAEQGQANYSAARAQVGKELLRIWPEALDPAAVFDPKEVRPLELNPKHQRALAEGFLGILQQKGTTGLQWSIVERLAGPGVEHKIPASGAGRWPEKTIMRDGCRVWGWVESHATQNAVPDFEGELDDEPALLDPVPAAAETVALPREEKEPWEAAKE